MKNVFCRKFICWPFFFFFSFSVVEVFDAERQVNVDIVRCGGLRAVPFGWQQIIRIAVQCLCNVRTGEVAQEACAVRMHVVLHVVPNPDEFDYLDMTAWWNGAKHRTDKAKRGAVVGERGGKEKKTTTKTKQKKHSRTAL